MTHQELHDALVKLTADYEAATGIRVQSVLFHFGRKEMPGMGMFPDYRPDVLLQVDIRTTAVR